MDISNTLGKFTNFLLKDHTLKTIVYIHSPSEHTLKRWLIVIEIDISSHLFNKSTTSSKSILTLKSSASGLNQAEAFGKAISEMGENLIMERRDFMTRSGIAGGLFISAATLRAKYELIERDAFLFHYRNQEPFPSAKALGRV